MEVSAFVVSVGLPRRFGDVKSPQCSQISIMINSLNYCNFVALTSNVIGSEQLFLKHCVFRLVNRMKRLNIGGLHKSRCT